MLHRYCRAFIIVLGSYLALAGPALAQGDRVSELASKLRDNPDFRLRTQAALALGATQQASAVSPLCAALDDVNTAVRSAAAAGLGKLGLGGDECLAKRLELEANQAVKSVIGKALERLRKTEPAGSPASARFYVAIGEVTNRTSRPDRELGAGVREMLIKAMGEKGGLAWAPLGETPAQASHVLRKHSHLKGVFVWPKVETSYDNGALTVAFSLSLFTYPDKSLVGSISRRLTMTGVSQPSRPDEDDLMTAAAERLIDAVTQTAAQM